MRYALRTGCFLCVVLSLVLTVLCGTELFAWEDAATETVDQEASEEPTEAPVPAKVRRYVDRIFAKYDKDLDGVLAPDEWLGMRGYPILIAGSAEETITKEQLTQYVAGYGYRRKIRLLFSPMKLDSFGPTLLHPSEENSNESTTPANGSTNAATPKNSDEAKQFYVPSKYLPNGLPNWFFARDTDGDGQLSFSEFAVEGTQSSIREFNKLDIDNDGILSPRDLVKTTPKKPNAKKVAKSGGSKPVASKPAPAPVATEPAATKPAPQKKPAAAAAQEEKPQPTDTPQAEATTKEEKPKPKRQGNNRGQRGQRRRGNRNRG